LIRKERAYSLTLRDIADKVKSEIILIHAVSNCGTFLLNERDQIVVLGIDFDGQE